MFKMFKRFKEIKRKNYINFFIYFGIVFVLGLAADIVTKQIALNTLAKVDGSVPFIPHVLRFTYVRNMGAAWGMGGGEIWSRVLLAVISWVVAIGLPIYILYLLSKNEKIKVVRGVALSLVWAGDIGNLIDRTFYKDGVIDFLDIQELIPGFGIFNLADSCLVVGIIMIIVLIIVEFIQEQVAQRKVNIAKIKEKEQIENIEKSDNNRDNEEVENKETDGRS